jgi:hypothetical protein
MPYHLLFVLARAIFSLSITRDAGTDTGRNPSIDHEAFVVMLYPLDPSRLSNSGIVWGNHVGRRGK